MATFFQAIQQRTYSIIQLLLPLHTKVKSNHKKRQGHRMVFYTQSIIIIDLNLNHNFNICLAYEQK